MKTRLPAFILSFLSFVFGLVGCDAQRISELEEGVSTEADVIARFGQPEKIWEAVDMAGLPGLEVAAAPGSRTFEYNRQPQGHVNYLITIGRDGRMSALRQTLTERNFSLVTPGMPMEKVRKMLGKPMKVTPYALKQETHYDWRYLRDPNTPRIFTVVFDPELHVVSTASSDDPDKEPGGRR
ncbi:MAG: outer membrane protein assembly factor BamE [Pseudomonadota bacterium]